MAKVTVIIPVYNGMPYIRQCLDSLMAQTLDDFDVVVVNDGSTDQTPQVLEEYQEKYPNIQVLSQENQGLYYARKNGLAIADGEYIGWIDADDFVRKDMFEKLYQAAVENDSDLAYCDYSFYPQKVSTKEKWYRPYTGKRDVNFVERNSQPWNKIARREVMNQLHMGELFPSCFDEIYIKLLIHARNPVSLDEELYFHRVGRTSMSTAYRNVAHYAKFIEASIRLKENMTEESSYWQEYFDYRIIYYTLMTMLVAAYVGDKSEYLKLKDELNQYDYKNNVHLKPILQTNFDSLKCIAIRDFIPMGYSVARLMGKVAFH